MDLRNAHAAAAQLRERLLLRQTVDPFHREAQNPPCRRLVLNIHPGLLEEVGLSRKETERWSKDGKLELRMQDAFDDLIPATITNGGSFDADIGILSAETPDKGSRPVAEAGRRGITSTASPSVWTRDRPRFRS